VFLFIECDDHGLRHVVNLPENSDAILGGCMKEGSVTTLFLCRSENG